MTLVHVALPTGRRSELGHQISRCVYQAIGDTLGVGSENRFEVVAEQWIDPGNDPQLQDVANMDRSAVVLIYMPGRYSGRKKRALFGRIAELLNSQLKIKARDVVIGLVHVPRENWSFWYSEDHLLETLPYQLP